MINLFKQNDAVEDIQPDPLDSGVGAIERGALEHSLINGPSLFTETQRARLQALQINIFKLRTQIFQANVNQAEDVAMWLCYVEMYHQEMNTIVTTACGFG